MVTLPRRRRQRVARSTVSVGGTVPIALTLACSRRLIDRFEEPLGAVLRRPFHIGGFDLSLAGEDFAIEEGELVDLRLCRGTLAAGKAGHLDGDGLEVAFVRTAAARDQSARRRPEPQGQNDDVQKYGRRHGARATVAMLRRVASRGSSVEKVKRNRHGHDENRPRISSRLWTRPLSD